MRVCNNKHVDIVVYEVPRIFRGDSIYEQHLYIYSYDIPQGKCKKLYNTLSECDPSWWDKYCNIRGCDSLHIVLFITRREIGFLDSLSDIRYNAIDSFLLTKDYITTILPECEIQF